MIRRTVLVCAVLGLLSASASARVWKDNRGEKVEGTFVRVHEGNVVIKTINAFSQQRLLRVPFEVLSSEDQEFVIADLKKNGRIKQLESVQGAQGKKPAGNAQPQGGERAPAGERAPSGGGDAGTPEGYPEYNYDNDGDEHRRSSDPGDAIEPSGDYPRYEYDNDGEEYRRSSDPGDAVEPSGDYPRIEYENDSEEYYNPDNSDAGMPDYGDGSYDAGGSSHDGSGYDVSGNPLPPTTSNTLPPTASTAAAAPYGGASAAALQCDTCKKEMPAGTKIGDACPHCAEAASKEESDEGSSIGVVVALIVGGAALILIVVVVVAIVVVSKRRPQPAPANYFQQGAWQR